MKTLADLEAELAKLVAKPKMTYRWCVRVGKLTRKIREERS